MSNIKEHVQVLKEGQSILPGNEQGFPFPPHHESHEEGGYDEIDLAKMGGLLLASKTQVLKLPDVDDITGQDNIDFFESSGSAGSEYLTDDTPNLLVLGGTGYIRKTADPLDPLYAFDWPELSVSLPTDTIKYVGVEYDSVSDRGKVVLRDLNNYNGRNEFLLGTAIEDSTGIHIVNNPQIASDIAHNAYHRVFDTLPLQRAERLGGLIPGETGTRNVTLSAGEIYDGFNEFEITAKDTSGSDEFTAYYRDGSGGWNAVTAQTQWDNAYYDGDTGTLIEMSPAKYGIQWIYASLDDELLFVYGQDQYGTIAAAVAAGPPTTLPDRLLMSAKLLGRIIFQKNDATAERIENVFGTVFSPAGVVDHTQLANIGTNTHAEIDAFMLNPSVEGTVTLLSGGLITSDNGGDIFIEPDAGGVTRIGSGTPIQAITEDDLYLAGIFETHGQYAFLTKSQNGIVGHIVTNANTNALAVALAEFRQGPPNDNSISIGAYSSIHSIAAYQKRGVILTDNDTEAIVYAARKSTGAHEFYAGEATPTDKRFEITPDEIILSPGLSGGIRKSTFKGSDTEFNIEVLEVVKDYTSDLFDAVGLTDSALIAGLPADSVLLGCKVRLDVRFSAPGLTDLTLIMGDISDNDGLLTVTGDLSLDTAGDEYKDRGVYWDSIGGLYLPALTNYTAYVTAVGANLDTLTAGQVTFYFYYLRI